jgi:copper homeostasis protein
MSRPIFEICVEGIDNLLAAQAGGGDRAELCASLLEGGITPSVGTVREALRQARIPFAVIVRPRGGDFLYTDNEFRSMVADVQAVRDAGAWGVVVGCLHPDGTVDEARMRALAEHARPLRVTCHRAFDMTRDPVEALEALVRCGIDRVLTSGQQDDAVAGTPLLRRLVQQAGDRIVVMGCGALTPDTIGAVRRDTGLREMHFSAPRAASSAMRFRNPRIGMGGTELDREYALTLTDPDRVRATIAAAG